jgi:putative ABC transport system permease protein
LNYSLRSVWVRRTTSVATVAGIALVVFVLACSQMLAAGLRETLGIAGSSDRALVLQQSAFAEPHSGISQSVLNVAAAAPGVRRGPEGAPLVTGESVARVTLLRTEDEERLVTIFVRGVSANVLALRTQVSVIEGRAPQPGADEAMVGKRLVGEYRGLTLGGSVEIKENRPIQIVGIFDARASAYESEIWTDIETVRTSLGWEGYLSSVTAQLDGPSEFDAFAEDVRVRTGEAAVAERESEYYSRISQGLATMITGLGRLIAAIFSIAAMLGAAITMYGSIGQRTREVGVFRALGFSRWHVLIAVSCEAGALALVGAGLGIALAICASLVELSTVNAATGAQIAFRFRPTLTILLRSILAGAVVGLLGGLFPALKAAKTSPLEALRS